MRAWFKGGSRFKAEHSFRETMSASEVTGVPFKSSEHSSLEVQVNLIEFSLVDGESWRSLPSTWWSFLPR